MGRKERIVAAVLVLVLLLSACSGGKNSAWQEQYDLGMRYLEEGDYEEAILAFSAAIEIDDSRPEAYMGRAQAYVAIGDTEKALKDYKKVRRAAKNSDGDYDDLIEEVEDLIEDLEDWLEWESMRIMVVDMEWEFIPGSEEGEPDRCFHLPYLMVDYEFGSEINIEIFDDLYNYLSGEVYRPGAESNDYVIYNTMVFDWKQQGDFVSILVRVEAEDPAWTEYYVYNASTVTGMRISDEELLATFDMGETEFRKLAETALEANGLSVDNIDLLIPYIGADGHLCVVAGASEPGDNGQYLYLFDLIAQTPLDPPVCTMEDHFYVEGNLREGEVVYEGYIIENSVAHRAWIDQMQEELGGYPCSAYGIRFDSPVTVNINGGMVTLKEVSMSYIPGGTERLVALLSSLDPDPETGILVRVRVTGLFWLEESCNERGYSVEESDGIVSYILYPNGKYDFTVTSFEIVK